MTQLFEIDEERVYCGPAALMAITGNRLPEIRSAINVARGFRDSQGVIGLSNAHLEQSMLILGVVFEKITQDERITLSNLAKVLEKNTRYIINVTGHYVTFLNDVVIDNHTRFGTNIDECKWSRKVVKSYYKIIDNHHN